MEDDESLVKEYCIICLSSVKAVDAIWSCDQCYCVFHLSCIQAWAKDSLHSLSTGLSAHLFPGQALLWSCPKCRKEHSVVPTTYLCYCHQKIDPPFDPWLKPHSCGQLCGRKNRCEHSCTSLCHSGACPPCPKTVSLSCYCGGSGCKVKRCGASGWSCERVCGKVLACGLHTCERTCHSDDCGTCSVLSLTSCVCGRRSDKKKCEDGVWSCDQPCEQLLSCGQHQCQKVCHDGVCGECPLSLPRNCPCGKTKHTLPCTEETPRCGSSCDKLLSCGVHRCTRPCHSSKCGVCVQVREARCRCGKHSKTLPCSSTTWLCDSKCQQLRGCGKHHCKRRCCDGQCPPCEQVCNKTLACRNHKCPSPCHQGRCYPCVRTVVVKCQCGASSRSVPCGQERHTTPPGCIEPCSLPSMCPHPHKCHPPPCPPCTKTCGLKLSCGHHCKAICHAAPKRKSRPQGLAPWVKVAESAMLVVEPCPPCRENVSVVCVGGHSKMMQLCSEKRQYSCGSVCGRKLLCGNHFCQRECHKTSVECEECVLDCSKSRPPGCTHDCPLGCHQGECPACEVMLKVTCHCGSLTLLHKCHELCDASANREQLKCCEGQCSKKLVCGHRCTLTCHSGPCSVKCSRKVTRRCPCGRIKKESPCVSQLKVTCDNECQQILQAKAQVLSEERERILEEEAAAELKVRLELERQQAPRRRRRTQGGGRGTEDTASTQKKGISPLLLALILAVIAGLALFLYSLIS